MDRHLGIYQSSEAAAAAVESGVLIAPYVVIISGNNNLVSMKLDRETPSAISYTNTPDSSSEDSSTDSSVEVEKAITINIKRYEPNQGARVDFNAVTEDTTNYPNVRLVAYTQEDYDQSVSGGDDTSYITSKTNTTSSGNNSSIYNVYSNNNLVIKAWALDGNNNVVDDDESDDNPYYAEFTIEVPQMYIYGGIDNINGPEGMAGFSLNNWSGESVTTKTVTYIQSEYDASIQAGSTPAEFYAYKGYQTDNSNWWNMQMQGNAVGQQVVAKTWLWDSANNDFYDFTESAFNPYYKGASYQVSSMTKLYYTSCNLTGLTLSLTPVISDAPQDSSYSVQYVIYSSSEEMDAGQNRDKWGDAFFEELGYSYANSGETISRTFTSLNDNEYVTCQAWIYDNNTNQRISISSQGNGNQYHAAE